MLAQGHLRKLTGCLQTHSTHISHPTQCCAASLLPGLAKAASPRKAGLPIAVRSCKNRRKRRRTSWRWLRRNCWLAFVVYSKTKVRTPNPTAISSSPSCGRIEIRNGKHPYKSLSLGCRSREKVNAPDGIFCCTRLIPWSMSNDHCTYPSRSIGTSSKLLMSQFRYFWRVQKRKINLYALKFKLQLIIGRGKHKPLFLWKEYISLDKCKSCYYLLSNVLWKAN